MNILQKILFGLSGADKKLLEECPQAEIIKHEAYGSLLLIPFLMGIGAMYFAIEALEIKTLARIFISLIWGILVLIIDRSLLITYQKKKKFHIKNVILLFIRLTLALFIGVLLSHPLVIKLFERSVTEKLTDKLVLKIDTIQDITERKKQKELDKIDTLLFNKEIKLNEYQQALIAEANGTHIKATPIYKLSTTGTKGFKEHYIELKEGRDSARKEYTYLISQKENIINHYDSIKIAQRDSLQKYAAFDLLSKIESMEELKKDRNAANYAFSLIILFLIFLDLTPLLIKIMSEYEVYDTVLEKRKEYLQEQYCSIINERIKTQNDLSTLMQTWHANKIKNIFNAEDINTEEDLKNKLNMVFAPNSITNINRQLEKSSEKPYSVKESKVALVLSTAALFIFFITNMITPGEFINAIVALVAPSTAYIIYKKNKKND